MDFIKNELVIITYNKESIQSVFIIITTITKNNAIKIYKIINLDRVLRKIYKNSY